MKMVERIEPRDRSFAESRTYVVREVTAAQSERLLQAERPPAQGHAGDAQRARAGDGRPRA